MVVRLTAALWSIVALSSVVTVVRALLARRDDRFADVLGALVERTALFGKIERYLSLILMVATFVAFLAGSLNTGLWPVATSAWVALIAQSMFLRPYLTSYASLVERGFVRPIERVLVPYGVLDVVMVVPLVALVLDGTT